MKKRNCLFRLGLMFCAVTLVAALVALPVISQAAIQQKSADLIDEFTTIRNNMPDRDSDGFDLPTQEELGNWSTLIQHMLAENWSAAEETRAAHFPFYTLYEFIDQGNNYAVYYMLEENMPITKGWGTYVFATSDVWDMQIVVEIPHPAYEYATYIEGPEVWRLAKGRYIIMSGTHRYANTTPTPCTGSSKISDPAHTVNHPWYVAHKEIVDFDPTTYQFQFHGMSSCSEDIFLSNGSGSQVTDLLTQFRYNLFFEEGFDAETPNTSSCSLVASTNTEGRYTNGSSDPCTENAPSVTEYFVHMEQLLSVRETESNYRRIANAIRSTFPTTCTVPADCDDSDPCKTYNCVEGTCSKTPMDCDDFSACTTDYCSDGVCYNDPITCDDADPCTTDVCTAGACSNTPIDCDDGNACTADSCDHTDGSCIHDPLCPSGTVCGNGVCEGNGEDCFTCALDCRGTGKNNRNSCCGDGTCAKENVNNCPVDCVE